MTSVQVFLLVITSILASISTDLVMGRNYRAATMSYSVELGNLVDRDKSLSGWERHYFEAVLNKYYYSNCHQPISGYKVTFFSHGVIFFSRPITTILTINMTVKYKGELFRKQNNF